MKREVDSSCVPEAIILLHCLDNLVVIIASIL